MSGANDVSAATVNVAGSGGLPVMMLPTVTHPAAIIACVLPTISITFGCARRPIIYAGTRGVCYKPLIHYDAFLRLFPRGINTLIRMAAAVSEPAKM